MNIKNENVYKVKIQLPIGVIDKIKNIEGTRFFKAKLLVLAHYYYNMGNNSLIITAEDFNKYLGVRNPQGAILRKTLLDNNIIMLIDTATTARDANGKYYRKGFDLFVKEDYGELTSTYLLTNDATFFNGKYKNILLTKLNLILELTQFSDSKYNLKSIKNSNKVEISKKDEILIEEEVKVIDEMDEIELYEMEKLAEEKEKENYLNPAIMGEIKPLDVKQDLDAINKILNMSEEDFYNDIYNYIQKEKRKDWELKTSKLKEERVSQLLNRCKKIGLKSDEFLKINQILLKKSLEASISFELNITNEYSQTQQFLNN